MNQFPAHLIVCAIGLIQLLVSSAEAATGNLFASTGAEVRQFSQTGEDLGTFAKSGLQAPTGIKFDGSGNLYVADARLNIIRKFSPTGEDLGIFANTGL